MKSSFSTVSSYSDHKFAVKDAPTTIRDSLRLTNAVEDPGYMTLSLISENKVDDLMFNSKMFQDHMVNDFRPKFSHADSSEIMITLNNLKNDILSTKNIRELESTDLRSEVAKQFAARRAELVSHLNASLRPLIDEVFSMEQRLKAFDAENADFVGKTKQYKSTFRSEVHSRIRAGQSKLDALRHGLQTEINSLEAIIEREFAQAANRLNQEVSNFKESFDASERNIKLQKKHVISGMNEKIKSFAESVAKYLPILKKNSEERRFNQMMMQKNLAEIMTVLSDNSEHFGDYCFSDLVPDTRIFDAIMTTKVD
ncbi:Gamma giardin [Giardia duodenalis assemblage B]|uniref:Giardin subunit gamma n=5 Tax=Giardia intestinalis TaxID=5741 RepID=GIAG_GIAIN|nr:Gamma giardin [Giardia intestinalis]P38413.1 RecName: Full=Giardin subunit gamma; AltName: Full=Gamma-giardin; AltName: Full=Glgamma-giardin [Giardia intestinalis]EFO64485.1 Gamma giardin [Giardia lamblia P15]KWX12461.1 Gamma giardin [Giardia intestinalis assemblage B]ABW38699.1 gamma giardin protein [Giardia intestinalis]ABW38705.1 gamma giardin protein [Giardia intestinalis]ABW38711.1 gamma giardin protein [Giardia intestinalis]|eukprot:XP_001706274.1 Gamma giardin [Giardia lamblia ATCC 50803]